MRRLFVPALLAALAAGCNTEYENPFASTNPTVPPRAEADIVFASNGYRTQGGAPREIFSVEDGGAGLARLTFCNTEPRRCDSVEAAPAPDRKRMVVRRIADDTNRDGRLTAADGHGLLMVDLSRGVEGTLLPPTSQVTGIDWSPPGTLIIYSAAGEGGLEDLFLMEAGLGPDGKPVISRLTSSGAVAERRPRFDPTGSRAVFERSDASARGQIVVFNSQSALSPGAPAGAEALPGTPYFVGSDADPAYSPDGRAVVFRRLTGTGNGGLGTWDILTVRIDPFRADGSGLSRVATGPAFRGAPDWAPQGIVFNEIDLGAGTSRLMLLPSDSPAPRALVTMGAAFEINFPRFFHP